MFAFAVFREDGRAAEFVLLAERGPCFFVLVQAVDIDEVDFAVQVAAGDVAFEHGFEGVAVAAARAADVGVNGVSVGDAFFEAFDGQAVEVEVDVGIGVFQPLGVFGGKAHGGLRFGQAVFQGFGFTVGGAGTQEQRGGQDGQDFHDLAPWLR